jgi:hypothetical protein
MGEARRRKLMAATAGAAATLPTAALWQLSNQTSQTQIEEWFVRHDIDPSKPGLHDSATFLRVERQDPKALNMVARLVEARTYSAKDLLAAEKRVQVAADAVGNRVARDGRPGLCVVASGILSRILDELGVWNYTAKTNLAIYFPQAVSKEARYFYSIDVSHFTAPHAIVVAPPFAIVDVTVKYQAYDDVAMAKALPILAMTKVFRPYRLSPAELISPEVRMDLSMRGMSIERFLASNKPDMLELMKHLPSREITFGESRLGYGLVAVGGYQEPLRELHDMNCRIDGKTPIEIYEHDVLPKL